MKVLLCKIIPTTKYFIITFITTEHYRKQDITENKIDIKHLLYETAISSILKYVNITNGPRLVYKGLKQMAGAWAFK